MGNEQMAVDGRQWWGRAIRALDLLVPRRGELDSYFVTSAFALFTLVGMRCVVALSVQEKVSYADWYALAFGDFEFWVLWAFGWSLATRPFRGWLRGIARGLFHLSSAILVLCSVIDLAFFEVTGSRGDLDSIGYALANFSRVLPVAASEVHGNQMAGVALVVVLVFAPIFRRWNPDLGGWPARLSLVLLLPVGWMETQGRPKPAKSVRELQPSFSEMLFYEWLDSRGDVVIAPLPEDVVPLRVEPVAEAARPNIVVVLLESISAPSTTPYTPDLATTPNLDRFAREGLLVEEAYAVVPHTSKAIVATLCGDWPQLQTEIREAQGGGLPGRCLPHLLTDLGYRSAFFQTAREDFEDRVSLTKNLGFDTFRARSTLQTGEWEKNNYFGIDDRAMLAPGIHWSTADDRRPFFATYLTLASHHNYKVPKGAPNEDWPEITGKREQYLDSVHFVDGFVGQLVAAYEEKGLLDDTIFVFVGDHGEGFGEHGRFQHDLVIYDEGLRIPMILWGPPLQRAGVVEGPRQQIDLLPTIVELAGGKIVGGLLRGQSLFEEVSPERVLYHSCWRSHRCIARREGSEKFIDHYRDQPAQVFETTADPGETEDLSSSRRGEIAGLRKDAREWRGRVEGRFAVLESMWQESIQRPDDAEAMATWGGKISLLGCEGPRGKITPGDTAWVTCRWRAEQGVARPWKMRAGLKVGKRTTNNDHVPGNGGWPTWRWRSGWAVEDTFRIQVPEYAAAGKGTLSVGWVNAAGQEIPIDGKDTKRLEIGTIDIDKRLKLQLKAAKTPTSVAVPG